MTVFQRCDKSIFKIVMFENLLKNEHFKNCLNFMIFSSSEEAISMDIP